MLQILFFLSMLCITAMLLKLFWYLDDSHEEEIRINMMRYRHRILVTPRSLYPNRPSSTYRPAAGRTSAVVRQIHFYDVGTGEDTVDVPTISKHIECA